MDQTHKKMGVKCKKSIYLHLQTLNYIIQLNSIYYGGYQI
jgi:hypothetical protein